MSFYISSKDVPYNLLIYDYDNKFDTTYTLSKNVQGLYQMVDQHFETSSSDFYWVQTTNNQLVMKDPLNSIGPVYINFDPIYKTDHVSILAWFNATFAQLNDNGFNVQWTSTYNIDDDTYHFNFTTRLTNIPRVLDTSFYGQGESTGLPYSESSIAGVFGWHNGASDLMTNAFTEFVVSGQNFGFPSYLEVECEQVTSKVYSSGSRNPSFFISTSGSIIDQQFIQIPESTNQLSLKIYKPGHYNNGSNIYAYNADFNFFFKKIDV